MYLYQMGRRARAGGACVVCLAERKCVVLLPCAHLCLCAGCALRFVGRGAVCPVCRTAVEDALAVYW